MYQNAEILESLEALPRIVSNSDLSPDATIENRNGNVSSSSLRLDQIVQVGALVPSLNGEGRGTLLED